jgi:GNAT superfamily N-acetyltransferase
MPEDATAMAEAHVHGWRAAYRGMVPDAHLDGLSVDQRAAMWTRLLSGPPDQRRHWVIETDRVQGFAGTGPTRDDDDDPQRISELMVIYLRPDVVGTGLGRALLEHAVADVRSRGWAGMSLWVFEDNARGRRFYERAGFAPDGTRKSFELGGATLWELRYRLPIR